jgi:tellurite resistance protein TerC
MLAHIWLDEIGFTTAHSLYFILFILGISIGASLMLPEKKKKGLKA